LINTKYSYIGFPDCQLALFYKRFKQLLDKYIILRVALNPDMRITESIFRLVLNHQEV